MRDGHDPQVEAVTPPDQLYCRQSLWEVVPGIDENYLDPRLHLGSYVDQHRVRH